MEYVLALDLGSSSIKAEAFGPGALPLGHVRVTPVQRDKELWVQSIQEAAASAIKQLQTQVTGKAKAMVFSAAMHQIMAVDARGIPLTPVWSWDDQRAQQEAQEWIQRRDARHWWQNTGTPLLPLNPFFKLQWLRQHDPGIWERSAWFCSPKEFLLWQWFGIKVLDYSLASASGLMQSGKGNWYAPALDALSIDPDRLSELVPPEVAINVNPDHCGFQLTKNFKVYPGGSDGTLANLGCGSLAIDTAVLTIGTSGAYRINASLEHSAIGTNYFHYHQTLYRKVSGGATNNGGNAFQSGWKWLGKKELPAHTWQELFTRAAKRYHYQPIGRLLKPYFLGERAPIALNSALPSLEGGTSVKDYEEATWLIAEGVLRNLMAIQSEIHQWTPLPEYTYLSGGFFKLPGMSELAAALWPTPVRTVDTEDVSTRGAYLLIQDQVE